MKLLDGARSFRPPPGGPMPLVGNACPGTPGPLKRILQGLCSGCYFPDFFRLILRKRTISVRLSKLEIV